MKTFFLFLLRVLLWSLVFSAATVISIFAAMFITWIIDPDWCLFCNRDDTPIIPFLIVHVLVLAMVSTYYALFYPFRKNIRFSREWGVIVSCIYVVGLLSSVLFYHYMNMDTYMNPDRLSLSYHAIDIIYRMVFLGSCFIYCCFFLLEIYRSICGSAAYKSVQSEKSRKYPFITSIWSVLLNFDLLWFVDSSNPMKEKWSKNTEIILYVILASSLFFWVPFLLSNQWIFDIATNVIRLNLNGEIVSLEKAMHWMWQQQSEFHIGWMEQYREIYRLINVAHNIGGSVGSVLLFFFLLWMGSVLENRKWRLYSLLSFLVISPLMFFIWYIYLTKL